MADLLLVEDSVDLADLLEALLTDSGHTVRVAKDGAEGLRYLDGRFPQLVITDIEMPVLDGPAMIYRMFVKDLGRENIPVILISASDSLVAVAEAIGTPYCVKKPFDLPELEATIERALDEAIPPKPRL